MTHMVGVKENTWNYVRPVGRSHTCPGACYALVALYSKQVDIVCQCDNALDYMQPLLILGFHETMAIGGTHLVTQLQRNRATPGPV